MEQGEKKRKPNPWMVHLKKIRDMPENKDLLLGEVMRKAKETYKKENKR